MDRKLKPNNKSLENASFSGIMDAFWSFVYRGEFAQANKTLPRLRVRSFLVILSIGSIDYC